MTAPWVKGKREREDERMTTPLLRRLGPPDLAAVLTLLEAEGWAYDAGDLDLVLKTGTLWGHIDHTGSPISCAAVTLFGERMAALGLVMVQREYRGRGLGSQLVEHAVHRVAGAVPVGLVSNPSATALYRRLGFVPVETIVTLKRSAKSLKTPTPPASTNPYHEALQTAVMAADACANGFPREDFLAAWLSKADRVRVAGEAHHRLSGFAVATKRGDALHVGPLTANDPDTALTLLLDLLDGYGGPVRIDLVSEQPQLIQRLRALGFRETGRSPYMARPPLGLPLGDGTRYAIAAQAWG